MFHYSERAERNVFITDDSVGKFLAHSEREGFQAVSSPAAAKTFPNLAQARSLLAASETVQQLGFTQAVYAEVALRFTVIRIE
jgi:hypothetical protein